MSSMLERLGSLFGHVGFDLAFPNLELVHAQDGKATVRLPVGPAVQNIHGALHGGAVATLVDIAGTMAIITGDREHRAGVTTDLNVSYMAPGKGVVEATATVLRCGRTLAFVECDIRRVEDGVLVAQGRMTKFMS